MVCARLQEFELQRLRSERCAGTHSAAHLFAALTWRCPLSRPPFRLSSLLYRLCRLRTPPLPQSRAGWRQISISGAQGQDTQPIRLTSNLDTPGSTPYFATLVTDGFVRLRPDSVRYRSDNNALPKTHAGQQAMLFHRIRANVTASGSADECICSGTVASLHCFRCLLSCL